MKHETQGLEDLHIPTPHYTTLILCKIYKPDLLRPDYVPFYIIYQICKPIIFLLYFPTHTFVFRINYYNYNKYSYLYVSVCVCRRR